MQAKMNFILFPILAELLEEADLQDGDVIEMTATDGRITICRADVNEEEFVCDGDCDSCPFEAKDCDENCEQCPCSDCCDEREDF